MSCFFEDILWPATLLKLRLQCGCFPVNTVKFLRAAFLKNNFGDCFCYEWVIIEGHSM